MIAVVVAGSLLLVFGVVALVAASRGYIENEELMRGRPKPSPTEADEFGDEGYSILPVRACQPSPRRALLHDRGADRSMSHRAERPSMRAQFFVLGIVTILGAWLTGWLLG